MYFAWYFSDGGAQDGRVGLAAFFLSLLAMIQQFKELIKKEK
ncbi:hypothetical protein [Peribacillus asahii]